MRRLGITLAVALPLAAADLWVKTVRPTAPWAYHERSLGWLGLSVFLAAGLAVLTRVPSRLVPLAAGVLAGGLLGNALSAAWNDMQVPNPLVLEDGPTVIAFNLADVWALTGIAALVATLGVWLIRNWEMLPAAADVRTRWGRAFRRRP